MNRLLRLIGQYRRRSLLVFVAALLLLLNLGRLGFGYFNDWEAQVENRRELLEQYYDTSRELPDLQRRVAILEKQQQHLETYLFKGGSEEEIASAMQIMLQGLVIKAGLEPEFLRPVRTGVKTAHKEKEYDEIAINVRLAGDLNNFMKFISSLYTSKYLFKIESLTLKPYKETNLKIFLEIKGYYKAI